MYHNTQVITDNIKQLQPTAFSLNKRKLPHIRIIVLGTYSPRLKCHVTKILLIYKKVTCL